MARIVGVELPKGKRIDVALTYIYGIGPFTSQRVLHHAQIDPHLRAKDLSDEQVARLTQAIQSSTEKVEGELRRDVSSHIRRLIDIGCYRGTRHKRGLSVRGQHTRTNARTRKGPRPRVGGKKRPISAR